MINKAGLVAGDPTVKFAHFGSLKIDGQTTLAPQAALSTVKPHAEFMLSSLDFSGQGDNRIGVWAITDRAAVASGGCRRCPASSSTPSSTRTRRRRRRRAPRPKLNPDDDRMQQTEFADNSIWGELTTAVTPAGDTAVRSGGAWFQVKPRLSGGVVTGAKIVRQGYLDAPGQYLTIRRFSRTPRGTPRPSSPSPTRPSSRVPPTPN